MIRDARFFDPNWMQDVDTIKCTETIEQLTEALWDALGDQKMIPLFNLKQNANKYVLIDLLRKELELFKLESLPENFNSSEKPKTKVSKPSYWRKCYDLADLETDVAESDECEIEVKESYWMKVMEPKDGDGKCKYWHLGILAINILLLPHGNEDPERGFSINPLKPKHFFNIHCHAPTIIFTVPYLIPAIFYIFFIFLPNFKKYAITPVLQRIRKSVRPHLKANILYFMILEKNNFRNP